MIIVKRVWFHGLIHDGICYLCYHLFHETLRIELFTYKVWHFGFFQSERRQGWYIFLINRSSGYIPRFIIMASLCRIELSRDELLDIEPEATWLVEKIGWRKFFGSLDGYNSKVTLTFALSLKDNIAQVGDVTLVLSDGFLSRAHQLPQVGEILFNKGEVNKAKWKQFLLPWPTDYNGKFGYSVKFLKA